MVWPTRRGDETLIRTEHPAQADYLRQMLYTGDPLADAAVAEMGELGGHGRRLLLDGLRDGLDSLTDPPAAIAALLEQVESVTAAADHDELDRGSATYLTIPYFAHVVALGQGSLVNTYSAPSIAAVLLRTGKLITMAERRLNETGKWSTQTMLPGGMRRGAGGYTATVMVRILHAYVRAGALRHGWETTEWGVPINQVDQARTWLDLNYVPYRALTTMGYDFTKEELSAVYRRWRHIAQLLGVDDGFSLQVVDHASAATVSELIETAIGAPDDGCRKLVASLCEASVDMMTPALGIPATLTDDLMRAYIWLIHGPDRARELGVAPSDLLALLPLLIDNTRQNRRLQRMLPEVWREQQLANQAVIEQILTQHDAPTVYETAAAEGA
ncbi:oxygenase MpaB family protein [Nonomuraea sp. NPDC049152]|uniref:oxygenase MpaB family protein n=1 Tax=Nonomuraea sp. NPDC049152 TaxID=3154350 RepID=UPI0033D1D830